MYKEFEVGKGKESSSHTKGSMGKGVELLIKGEKQASHEGPTLTIKGDGSSVMAVVGLQVQTLLSYFRLLC